MRSVLETTLHFWDQWPEFITGDHIDATEMIDWLREEWHPQLTAALAREGFVADRLLQPAVGRVIQQLAEAIVFEANL